MSKVFIFGIDGGSFTIIDELAREGRLPTFRRFMQEGVRCTLRSTVPPHTAPGWVSATTGVGPGTHGIYQFWDTQGSGYIGKFMGSKDWGALPIWKILNGVGLQTGVINVPMTHPPYPVDGFMISWPLSNTLRYSYPENLLSEIAVQGGHYLPDISVMYRGEEDYLEKALAITEKRMQTIKYLVETKEWDFLMAVFPEVDRICHFYWHYWDQTSREYSPDAAPKDREAIAQIYQAMDQTLESVLNILPEETCLMVISDHGFGAGEMNFNVQTFLLDKGFLKVESGECVVQDESVTVENSAGNWFSYEHEGKGYGVDWSQTVAYMAAPGSYGINVNLKGRQEQGIVEEAEFEQVRTRLIEELMTVKHPATGEPLFERICRSEEIYQGVRQKNAPDLLLIPKSFGVMVNHNLIPGQWFSSPEQKGMHRQEGIFLAAGPNVKKDQVLEPAKLEDILPTVLNYFGLPIPQYVEGDIIPMCTEAIEPVSYVTDQTMGSEVENSYSPEEQAEIEDRLLALGYL